jgi:hypothetical protein
MSRYPRERIESRLSYFAIAGAHRVFAASRMPLSVHPSPSRFCDGATTFAVLYAALTFETCIAESLIRDRFVHRTRRELPLAAVLMRAHAQIATQPEAELLLLDLRDTGCLDIGAPTDAVRARHFAAGQALGRAIYAEHPDVDGVIYASRLTGDDCFAVFDRALHKFLVIDACALKDHPQLPAVLEQGRISLMDDEDRGTA